MLEVLTPLSKCVRVTRSIDVDDFVANPGIWAYVDTDGSIKNQVGDAVAKLNKIVMTSATDNIYESHDIEAGRITTLEGPSGIRFKVDLDGYCGTLAQGDALIVKVDAKSADIGKLTNLAGVTKTGIYEIVARCEQINDDEDWIIAELVCNGTVTKS